MAFLLTLLCCRTSASYPLALGSLLLARKVVGLSGPGPGLSDSEAYALLQAFFNPRLALPSLLCFVILVRGSRGRSWLPFIALVGLATPQLDCLSSFAGPSSGLLNGLVLIHPPLLFLGYACLATLVLDLPRPQAALWLGSHPHPLGTKALVTFLLALMLGSVWAQHELNWGGWWGWDLVELGSLFFLLLAWAFTHQPAWTYGPSKLARQGLAFFLLFYLGLRYGLFDSVHSFVGPSSRLAPHIPFAYALPWLLALWPGLPRSRHLLGVALAAGLGIVWLRAGVDQLSPSLQGLCKLPISKVVTLALGFGATLLHHRGGFWPLFGWSPFFIATFGQYWFLRYKPRGVHGLVVLALLGLPLLKLAPVQLATLYNPLIDAVALGSASLTTLSVPGLEAYNALGVSNPLHTRADYYVQPGLHPALDALLAPAGAWSHGAFVKNLLTLLSLQALGTLYVVPSFYLVFILGLAKKHQPQQT